MNSITPTVSAPRRTGNAKPPSHDARPLAQAVPAAPTFFVTSRPPFTRQGRSTQRALAFMRENLAEPLTLEQVATVAGFAPDSFSRLLKRDEGLNFDGYLQRMRLERAKHRLTSTQVPLGRVAQLSGFKSRPHFQQAFKRYLGSTPGEYRATTQVGLVFT